MNVAELRKLLAGATPGPWRQQRDWPLHIVPDGQERRPWGASADPTEDRERYAHPIAIVELDDLTLRDAPWVAEEFPHRRFYPEVSQADAALIAAAVNALPALFDVVEKAQAISEWWNTTHSDECGHDHHCLAEATEPEPCTCGWTTAEPALDGLADALAALEMVR